MAGQAVIDKVLEFARTKIDADVSGLLGVQFSTADLDTRLLSKTDIFESADKKVFTRMRVEGELAGEAFIAVSLSAAIRLGGTLIMLPEGEITKHINDENFGADESDAFGEIANIIAGVFSSGFEEHYPKKIRIFKADIEIVEPDKVDIVSDAPFPDQAYSVSSCAMQMDGNELGNLDILLPAALFDLGELKPQQAVKPAVPPSTPASRPASRPEASPEASPEAVAESAPADTPAARPSEVCASRVLVITDIDNENGAVFFETLQACGYPVACLNFADNVKDVLQEAGARGVFLVMNEVTDKGIAAIIKTKSACGSAAPLIAAGPHWTRSTVLQAVKYGACDIIVTPPVPDEIRQKAQVHLGAGPEEVDSESG
jgi:chemotaxis protein CheY-P-specific phosphatase CheC